MARHEPRLALRGTGEVRRVSRTLHIPTLAVAILIAATTVSAQTTSATADRGYVVAVAESAFGNVTSQSYGAEFGVTVSPDIQVFGSFGHIGNVATSELSTAAQSIASALSQLQPNSVSFSVNEPATLFVGGVRYRFPVTSILKPYISGGLGVGSVSKDVKFLIGGTDVTNSISQYVTLGSDITGSESGLMFTFGGGVVWPVWEQLILDFHYQYGHISTDTPVGVSRAGIGVGLRF
jgi:opacity protein-like surface antigen